jgi:hypothetical protein
MRLWNSAGGSGQAHVLMITRAQTVGIGQSKTEASRSAPIMTDHGRVAHIELSQEAGQIGDMSVERVGLFADRLLG